MIKKARHINQVLGLNINVTPVDRLLSQLEERIKKNRKTFIVTLNPEMAVLACKDAQFKDIINHADVVIPDGVGIVWALGRRGIKSVKRLSGTDLMLALVKRGYKTLLLGAKPGVAQAAAKKLGVMGMTEPDVVEINKIKPDLLFVALGHGKQERWIVKNLPGLKVKLAMGVGGTLDQIAKPRLRAPKLLQLIGLEWLYRLIVQPWRIKRQLGLLKFVWLVK
jgi:N-acetylglucosaminyldiphosphoundecaprenol N-acetyl-beta-D-mannosaminyltransferase